MIHTDKLWKPLILILDVLIDEGKSSEPRTAAMRHLKKIMVDTSSFPLRLILGYHPDDLLAGAITDYIKKTEQKP